MCNCHSRVEVLVRTVSIFVNRPHRAYFSDETQHLPLAESALAAACGRKSGAAGLNRAQVSGGFDKISAFSMSGP